jgi:hypothetical protein
MKHSDSKKFIYMRKSVGASHKQIVAGFTAEGDELLEMTPIS